jgi:hypothetical protein
MRMVLLTNNAEKAIAMLEKNYGVFEKIIEQLMKEVRLQKQVKDSRDFQEFSNLVENLAMTVENVGKKSMQRCKSRLKFAENHRLCFCCLLNHGRGNCLSKKTCGVNGCTRKHHQMLHKDEKQSGSISGVVSVQIMVATVTLALCDEASTTTLIDAFFAEQISEI